MTCNYNDDSVNEINSTNEACAETACEPIQTGTTCTSYSCNCGCDPCQCQQSSIASPLPFYNQAPTCQEDHTKILLQQNFITAVSTGVSFNMPACNASVSISLPGVHTLLVGGYLWNPTYGYLHIVAFDFTTSRAIVTNECQLSNASPGTEIPSCTLFDVVDPPFEIETECGDGSFITSNFTVPAIGASVTIDVSSTVGLTVNNRVQVGTGVYTLTVIITSNSITIKNDTGLGAAPGTVVSAYDVLGHCITPVTPYSPDICSNVAESVGSLVICSESGELTTLDATMAGQVPVCVDPATNTFEAQNTYIEIPVCTFLTACLTLISGTDDYTILVDDSSDFSAGEVIIISYPGLEDVYYIITDVPDGTHIDIHAIVTNTIDLVVPENTEVCHASCCDQIDYYLTHPCDLDLSDAQATELETGYQNDISTTLTAGSPYYESPVSTVTLVNPTCNDMDCLVTVSFFFDSTFNVVRGDWARVGFSALVGTAVPPASPVPAIVRTIYDDICFGAGNVADPCYPYESYYSKDFVYSGIVTVPANSSLQFDAQMHINYLKYVGDAETCCNCADVSAPGTGLMTITHGNAFIQAIGVAVQAAP